MDIFSKTYLATQRTAQSYYRFHVATILYLVLGWLQCWAGYSVGLATVLGWLQCWAGYSIGLATVLGWLHPVH